MNSELTAVVSSNNDVTVGWLMKNNSAYLVNLKLICEAQGVFYDKFQIELALYGSKFIENGNFLDFKCLNNFL